MCNKLICVLFIVKNVLVASVVDLNDLENVWTQQVEPQFKYTVDQLLSSDFPTKISDDIYLDPCKAGKSNKTFQLESTQIGSFTDSRVELGISRVLF